MHQIIDGGRFRSVLGRVLQRFGTHQEAAKALGIERSVFSRLYKGTVSQRIFSNTYQHIREGLRRISPTDLRSRRSLLNWARDLEHDFELSVLTTNGYLGQHQYQRWLREEIHRLEPKVRPVFEEMFADPTYQPIFSRFLAEMTPRSDLPPAQGNRAWLALYRALEPLGDSGATWGVERTWQEMRDADELGPYLRAALKRERIMLNRERDFARVNLCQPPSEWLDRMAKDTPAGQGRRRRQAAAVPKLRTVIEE